MNKDICISNPTVDCLDCKGAGVCQYNRAILFRKKISMLENLDFKFTDDSGHHTRLFKPTDNLTPRDYFAGLAMQNLMQVTPEESEIPGRNLEGLMEILTKTAFMCADEMMKARKTTPEDALE